MGGLINSPVGINQHHTLCIILIVTRSVHHPMFRLLQLIMQLSGLLVPECIRHHRVDPSEIAACRGHYLNVGVNGVKLAVVDVIEIGGAADHQLRIGQCKRFNIAV
jgi:hypothetical protein